MLFRVWRRADRAVYESEFGMTEHFTRNTVSAFLHCKKCGKQTEHRIDGVKRGPCLDCVAELERQHKMAEAVRQAHGRTEKQIDLFPGIL